MQHTKLPGNERNGELHPACSAKLLHLMCFSLQWLGVLCPSCTHFSWVPVCNVRPIWIMADDANKTHCLSKTSQCSFSHAQLGILRTCTGLSLMQCTSWCTMGWGPHQQNHCTYHEKTMGSCLWKKCNYHIQGTWWMHHRVTMLRPNSQSCHTSTFRFSTLI